MADEAQHEAIHKRIDQVGQAVDRLTVAINDLEKSHVTLVPSMARLDHAVFGNGRDGLVREMAKVTLTLRMLVWMVSAMGGPTVAGVVGLWFR